LGWCASGPPSGSNKKSGPIEVRTKDEQTATWVKISSRNQSPPRHAEFSPALQRAPHGLQRLSALIAGEPKTTKEVTLQARRRPKRLRMRPIDGHSSQTHGLSRGFAQAFSRTKGAAHHAKTPPAIGRRDRINAIQRNSPPGPNLQARAGRRGSPSEIRTPQRHFPHPRRGRGRRAQTHQTRPMTRNAINRTQSTTPKVRPRPRTPGKFRCHSPLDIPEDSDSSLPASWFEKSVFPTLPFLLVVHIRLGHAPPCLW